MTQVTREELIALCERARVPQAKWRNRDSAGAQRQIGEAWALLSASCDFEVLHEKGGLNSDANTWWIVISYEGFNFHESFSDLDGDDRADYLETDNAYIPTAARLDKAAGGDWY
jgi:hypothetical protein